jgi:hypothetical protein
MMARTGKVDRRRPPRPDWDSPKIAADATLASHDSSPARLRIQLESRPDERKIAKRMAGRHGG